MLLYLHNLVKRLFYCNEAENKSQGGREGSKAELFFSPASPMADVAGQLLAGREIRARTVLSGNVESRAKLSYQSLNVLSSKGIENPSKIHD